MVQKEQIGTLSVHESPHSDFMAIQRHRACMRIVQNLVDLFKFRDGSTGGCVGGGLLISISRDRKIGNIIHSIIVIKLKVIIYNLIQSNSMSLAIQCKCNNVYQVI